MAEGEREVNSMGQCCKCGRETRNAYEYYECEKTVSDGIVSYENMEKRSDFLCSRCVLISSAVGTSLFFLVYLCIAVGADIWSAMRSWGLWALAAVSFGSALYFWIRVLLDKRLLFKASADVAVGHIIKIKQGQNPEKVYFTSLEEYEKLTEGVSL